MFFKKKNVTVCFHDFWYYKKIELNVTIKSWNLSILRLEYGNVLYQENKTSLYTFMIFGIIKKIELNNTINCGIHNV